MAVTDNTTLIASIADYLHRTDLATIIPEWILDAEAVMNYGSEDLGVEGIRTAAQETTWTSASTVPAITVVNSQRVLLPTDVLEFRDPLYLTVSGVRRELENITSAPMSVLTQSNTPSIPGAYYIRGGYIYFDCAANGAYPMTGSYYATIGPIATSLTNWLLTLNPNIYRQGAIACSGGWLGPNFNLDPYIARFKLGISQINHFDSRKRFKNLRMGCESADMLSGNEYPYSNFLAGL